ncbi:quinol monooxygenase [Desulfosarcina ovata subsp. sediminis]|uniref:Quinol monooxygenase n=1 Tax=Desulfosarcina ovata subsp. sediminis TaxID=885957 RepID=A0A5K7ZWN3_9BACT|nr:putative quinol monooxygenase [Desulfosarcina ovata]BBO84677.1 quinol monooxygenase [Desulfosarcina ovata subsp. sediminis]
MIHVIASILVKAGKADEFLEMFKANVPSVKAEPGCIAYMPTIDVDAGLPPQDLDPDRVVIIEKWESLDALHAHLKAPHMLAYRERTRDLVEKTVLNVLQEA